MSMPHWNLYGLMKNPAPWISRSIGEEMDMWNISAWIVVSLHGRLTDCKGSVVTRLQQNAKKDHFHNCVAKNWHPSSLWRAFKSASSTSSGAKNWNALKTQINWVLQTISIAILHWSPAVLMLKHLVLPVLTTSKLALPSLMLWSFIERGIQSHCPTSLFCYQHVHFYFNLPSKWKHTSVKPLYNGGDYCCISNYRPTSTLPVCSKISECCVKEQLCHHFIINGLQYPLQSGFHTGHSTPTPYCTVQMPGTMPWTIMNILWYCS